MNRNALLTFLFTIGDGAAGGVWNYSVISNFIYALDGGDTSIVGWMQGLQGTMQALAVSLFDDIVR